MVSLNDWGIPSEAAIKYSMGRGYDNFYKLPKIIECFISRANQELPKNYIVKPWTINLAVSVFKDNKLLLSLEYDNIEQDIVWCLDYLIKECK